MGMRVAIGQFNEITTETMAFARQLGIDSVQMNTPLLPGAARAHSPKLRHAGHAWAQRHPSESRSGRHCREGLLCRQSQRCTRARARELRGWLLSRAVRRVPVPGVRCVQVRRSGPIHWNDVL